MATKDENAFPKSTISKKKKKKKNSRKSNIIFFYNISW